MGVALGAALVLPAAAALAVFAGLGLGLALPFLLLGFVPALRRRLPRPGPWMARFQRILAVPMFLTALGLAWVLGRQTRRRRHGARPRRGAAARARSVVGRAGGDGWLPLAPALLAAVAAAARSCPTAAAPAPARTGGSLARRAVQRGAARRSFAPRARPVFVYFTADWCLTCKVNERAALDQDEVAEAFRARGIRVLVGDWTRGDAAIGRFLERHGRSGVPLYLYYAPGGEAEMLPQILTVGRLTAL